MDELRTQIWDYLYRESAAKTLDEIANHVGSDVVATRAAVNHQWFDLDSDRVAIAFGTRPNSASSLTDRSAD